MFLPLDFVTAKYCVFSMVTGHLNDGQLDDELDIIIIITRTGTAEWERARLHRVNRPPPLDHVRQKKKEEKDLLD